MQQRTFIAPPLPLAWPGPEVLQLGSPRSTFRADGSRWAASQLFFQRLVVPYRQHPGQHVVLANMVVPKRGCRVQERKGQHGLTQELMDVLQRLRRASVEELIERIDDLKSPKSIDLPRANVYAIPVSGMATIIAYSA
jgi:hypothetical protein